MTPKFPATLLSALVLLLFPQQGTPSPLTPDGLETIRLRGLRQTSVDFPAGAIAHLWFLNIQQTWMMARPQPLSGWGPPFKDLWLNLETRVSIETPGRTFSTQTVAWAALAALERHLTLPNAVEGTWSVPVYEMQNEYTSSSFGKFESRSSNPQNLLRSPGANGTSYPSAAKTRRAGARHFENETTVAPIIMYQTFTNQDVHPNSLIFLLHDFLWNVVWGQHASKDIAYDVMWDRTIETDPAPSGEKLIVNFSLLETPGHGAVIWNDIAEAIRQLLYKPTLWNQWKTFSASVFFEGETAPFLVVTLR